MAKKATRKAVAGTPAVTIRGSRASAASCPAGQVPAAKASKATKRVPIAPGQTVVLVPTGCVAAPAKRTAAKKTAAKRSAAKKTAAKRTAKKKTAAKIWPVSTASGIGETSISIGGNVYPKPAEQTFAEAQRALGIGATEMTVAGVTLSKQPWETFEDRLWH